MSMTRRNFVRWAGIGATAAAAGIAPASAGTGQPGQQAASGGLSPAERGIHPILEKDHPYLFVDSCMQMWPDAPFADAHRYGATVYGVTAWDPHLDVDRALEEDFFEEETETVHRENSVSFHLDASRVMFSPGNLRERMRMSRLGGGERVVDMFAGIGYFSIPMAVHSRPERILAIELNPNAYHYLCQNIRRNRVHDIVEPVLGDCAKVTPVGVADRVVMGMVQVTDRYLEKGILALRPGGILHYHQTVPSWLYPEAAARDVERAAAALGRSAELLNCIRVKKFSPGVVHAVIDARIDSNTVRIEGDF